MPPDQPDEPSIEEAIKILYQSLIEAWNRRNPEDFASLYEEDGISIGFDGSQMIGRDEIRSSLRQIFADHQTAAYLAKIREVRFLAPDVAILHAICGMVPSGKSDINPAVNAVQSLVARKHEDGWRIVLFQNTPAQFHGRPDLAEQMTDELRRLLKNGK